MSNLFFSCFFTFLPIHFNLSRRDFLMWIALIIISYILFIFFNILNYAQYYLSTKLTVNGFAQVLYTLQNSMSGSENTILDAVKGFFVHNGFFILLGTGIMIGAILIYLSNKKGKIHTKLDPKTFTKILKGTIIGMGCFLLFCNLF